MVNAPITIVNCDNAADLGRRDQQLGEPRSRGPELLPPAIDLARENVGPAMVDGASRLRAIPHLLAWNGFTFSRPPSPV
jgi:hypothetical protein